MQTETVLFVLLAAMVALAIVLFQYYHKTKRRGKLSVILSFLRFLALFGIFLLLINPKFTKNEYTLEKANLILLVDNSSSIQVSNGKKDIQSVLHQVKGNEAIRDRFNLEQYSFGSTLNTSDSLSFSEKNTNITKALASVDDIYANTNGAIVVLTDGNHTLGEDYGFYGKNQKLPIYPIVIGDTTRYEDVRIEQVNTNTYAFLKNKYPIEAYVSYEGTGRATTMVSILVDGKTVFRKNIELSNTANTKVVNTWLEASSVGIKNIQVKIDPLHNEKNTVNNQKVVAVEVIDEKTDIAIITDVLHPDIGALKKAIESNEQRSVSIKKPNVDVKDLEDVDLFLLYQPNLSFGAIYTYIKQKKANTFTITGPKTDWDFLNKVQNSYTKISYNQEEEVAPTLHLGSTIFNTADFSIKDFPPLESNLGEIMITKPSEVLLTQRIKGVELDEPLLAIIGNDSEREAVLFGENIWKWRMQSYRNDQSFKNFDDFMGKIILYVSTTKPKERLSLEYTSVYAGSSDAKITATYSDETFVFDANATIILKLKDTENGVSKEIPMLLREGYYEADVSYLSAGTYGFTATVKNEGLSKSGSFTILDFDVEQQFLSSDYKKLNRLAENTGGVLYYPLQANILTKNLTEDNRFLPTQKSKQNVVSLIDFKILLGLIVAVLAAEWFIRKYNGLT